MKKKSDDTLFEKIVTGLVGRGEMNHNPKTLAEFAKKIHDACIEAKKPKANKPKAKKLVK